MRMWLTGVLMCCVLAGCGSRDYTLKPVADLVPQAGASFDLQVQNYDLIRGGGSPERVEEYVLPFERKAIRLMESLGYRYVPGEKGVRYKVEAHLVCLDPTNQRIDRMEEAADDWRWPGFAPGYDYIAPTQSFVMGNGFSSLHPVGTACVGRMHLIVHTPGPNGKAVLYSGVWSGSNPEVPNCPVSACAGQLRDLLTSRLGKIFAADK